MNVLWLEDFGGGLRSDSATLVNMFRGLLNETVFDDEWDPEADLISFPQLLEEFFLAQSPVHKVRLLRHYADFRNQATDFSLANDVVVIDINLSRGVPPDTPLPEGFKDAALFHRKAGFFIYNQLVRQGFPAENICFLTGERESTFGEFSEHCQQALIPLPIAYGKDDAGLESFRAWLATRLASPYLRLRRGVIEASQTLRERIAEQPQVPIQFSLYLETGEARPASCMDLLATLESFLPAKVPAEQELMRRLRLFVRAFAHEWENDAKPNNIPRIGGDRLPYVLRAYGWVLKRTRNWLAHGKVLDKMTPEVAAFLFLVNTRAMFFLPPEAQRFEYQLFEIFGTPVAMLDEQIVRKQLEGSFAALQKSYEQTGGVLEVANYYDDLANKIEGLPASGVNFPLVLIRILFHRLAQRILRDELDVTVYKWDCRPGNFRLSEDRADFLNLLLRHIFLLAFRLQSRH